MSKEIQGLRRSARMSQVAIADDVAYLAARMRDAAGAPSDVEVASRRSPQRNPARDMA